MSKIIGKKLPNSKTAATKINIEQDEKLNKLAEKLGITKSNLINQLIGIGYKDITKTKRDF